MSSISINDLEKVYDQLAESIDAIPEAKRELFLVKLALLSANQMALLHKASMEGLFSNIISK